MPSPMGRAIGSKNLLSNRWQGEPWPRTCAHLPPCAGFAQGLKEEVRCFAPGPARPLGLATWCRFPKAVTGPQRHQQWHNVDGTREVARGHEETRLILWFLEGFLGYERCHQLQQTLWPTEGLFSCVRKICKALKDAVRLAAEFLGAPPVGPYCAVCSRASKTYTYVCCREGLHRAWCWLEVRLVAFLEGCPCCRGDGVEDGVPTP